MRTDGPSPAYRADLVLLAALSMLIYVAQAFAWPLTEGRDFPTYLGYYNQMWDKTPALHTLMLFRTPLAPLFIGGLYKLGGLFLLEAALSVCFVICVCATYYLGTLAGRMAAVTAAVAVALFPTFGTMFHQLSSDALYATVFMGWAAFMRRTVETPRLSHFAWHGVALFALTMVRPTGQLFLLFALVPLALSAFPWRRRLAAAALFSGVAAALLLSWSGYNYWRYDDFTVARGGAAQVPMYRVFAFDRLVSADNGPASRELAEAVTEDLLNRPPYNNYDLDAEAVLRSGDTRVWSDLAALSDRQWGWDADYSILRRVAFEAIARHPVEYLHGVLFSLWFTMRDVAKPPAPKMESTQEGADSSDGDAERDDGRFVPRSYAHWLSSNPEGVPRSNKPTAYPAWTVHRESMALPPRDGSTAAAEVFNAVISNLYPGMYIFLLIGFVGVALSSFQYKWFLLFLAGLGLLHLVILNASVTLSVYYRAPFDPVFILLGIAGFVRTGFRGRRVTAGLEQT